MPSASVVDVLRKWPSGVCRVKFGVSGLEMRDSRSQMAMEESAPAESRLFLQSVKCRLQR